MDRLVLTGTEITPPPHRDQGFPWARDWNNCKGQRYQRTVVNSAFQTRHGCYTHECPMTVTACTRLALDLANQNHRAGQVGKGTQEVPWLRSYRQLVVAKGGRVSVLQEAGPESYLCSSRQPYTQYAHAHTGSSK